MENLVNFQYKTTCAHVSLLKKRQKKKPFQYVACSSTVEAQKSSNNGETNTIWARQQNQAGTTLRLWNALGGIWSRVEDGTNPHRTRRSQWNEEGLNAAQIVKPLKANLWFVILGRMNKAYCTLFENMQHQCGLKPFYPLLDLTFVAKIRLAAHFSISSLINVQK